MRFNEITIGRFCDGILRELEIKTQRGSNVIGMKRVRKQAHAMYNRLSDRDFQSYRTDDLLVDI